MFFEGALHPTASPLASWVQRFGGYVGEISDPVDRNNDPWTETRSTLFRSSRGSVVIQSRHRLQPARSRRGGARRCR